jgi:hypothetical protein
VEERGKKRERKRKKEKRGKKERKKEKREEEREREERGREEKKRNVQVRYIIRYLCDPFSRRRTAASGLGDGMQKKDTEIPHERAFV